VLAGEIALLFGDARVPSQSLAVREGPPKGGRAPFNGGQPPESKSSKRVWWCFVETKGIGCRQTCGCVSNWSSKLGASSLQGRHSVQDVVVVKIPFRVPMLNLIKAWRSVRPCVDERFLRSRDRDKNRWPGSSV
jgi:hypothetical protein